MIFPLQWKNLCPLLKKLLNEKHHLCKLLKKKSEKNIFFVYFY